MKRIFEKVKADNRIIIGYSASLILLLITYLVTLIANNKLKQRTELIDHTYNVIFNLELMLSTIKDAETGARGYALTRDINFLDPYINSKERADSLQKFLLAFTKDNQVQQDRLIELKELMGKRFEIFKEAIDYYKNGASDSTFKVNEAQSESKRLMDKIRLSVSIMQNEEKHILGERDLKLKSTFSSIKTITITSLLLTLLLVVIGFVTYTKENKARKIAMQNIREYQQQLSNRIDELNTANAQLVQMRTMEKFAVTGRIARAIAHEVRNPLTNINLATNQLKTDIPAPDENTLYLFDIIGRNSNRINKLISELLQTTKFSELSFTTISVNDLLEDTLAMAKDRIELNHIIIEKNYKAACCINVDSEKIKIAFLNIIINAIEAMETGKGILKVGTKTEGKICVVDITDNGIGMDENSLSKLFEPYFTNKPNGNGLGLANTQNIIFNHKGIIHVSSTEGKGTTFIIRLNIA
jgi:signal transduction histidine kinase